jgi:hypothetical protein
VIRTVTIVTLGLLGWTGAAAAQTPTTRELTVRVGGRVQAQFSTTSISEADLIANETPPSSPIPSSLFETRRVRLGAELDYGDAVTGKLEMEYAMARLALRDTWMNVELDPALQLRVGQFKKPFSLMQLTTSSKWPVIERGVRMRGLQERLLADDQDSVVSRFRGAAVSGEEQELLETFGYQSFDLGASLHGAAGRFGYQVGLFNGAGSDARDDTNGKSVAGRVTWRVTTGTPLTLGAGVSTREFRMRTTPSILTRNGTAYEIDFELGDFRRPGLHLLGEATTGTNLGEGGEFAAAQLIAAWYRPVADRQFEGWELAGRVSYGDPQRSIAGDDAILLTPGLNLYFSGRNRLMLNWDVFLPRGASFQTVHALRVQAQIYFLTQLVQQDRT